MWWCNRQLADQRANKKRIRYGKSLFSFHGLFLPGNSIALANRKQQINVHCFYVVLDCPVIVVVTKANGQQVAVIMIINVAVSRRDKYSHVTKWPKCHNSDETATVPIVAGVATVAGRVTWPLFRNGCNAIIMNAIVCWPLDDRSV